MFYMVTLLPVIGLVQVGSQAMADRYVYIASVGPFMLAGVVLARTGEQMEQWGGRQKAQAVFTSGLVLLCVLLSSLTVRQIGIWKSSRALWTHAVQALEPIERNYQTSYGVYLFRANAFIAEGDLKQAMKDSSHAISLDPASPFAYTTRALIFEKMGDMDNAVLDYTRAVRIRPDPEVYNRRGIAFKKLRRYNEAINDFTSTISLAPNSPGVYYNRGNAYAEIHGYEEAIGDYTKAIAVSTRGHPDYFNNRAVVLRKLGREEEALRDVAAARNLLGAERLPPGVGAGTREKVIY
jgi:tetratricopeptide (TPR) repeat protein